MELEIITRIDRLFGIEPAIAGCPATEWLASRPELAAPMVSAWKQWLCGVRAKPSRHASMAKALDNMLKD